MVKRLTLAVLGLAVLTLTLTATEARATSLTGGFAIGSTFRWTDLSGAAGVPLASATSIDFAQDGTPILSFEVVGGVTFDLMAITYIDADPGGWGPSPSPGSGCSTGRGFEDTAGVFNFSGQNVPNTVATFSFSASNATVPAVPEPGTPSSSARASSV